LRGLVSSHRDLRRMLYDNGAELLGLDSKSQ
jgi:hypothetical protein